MKINASQGFPKGNPFGNPAKSSSPLETEFESANSSTVLLMKSKQETQMLNLIKSHDFGVSKGVLTPLGRSGKESEENPIERVFLSASLVTFVA